jgi:phosphopantetheine--protein transferase-like protein
MSEDGSTRINGFFSTSLCDLTPVSARHAACVLYSPISHDPEVTRHCASVLSDIELQRADRFVTEYDKTQFIQRRAFRRYCGAKALGASLSLSRVVFKETENRRPYLFNLPNLWFSFSSCRFGFLGAWSPTHGVGVDIEDQTRNMEAIELAHRFFSRGEASAVERASNMERLRTFLQFWCLKEAALKSIGEGLPYGLDAFEFKLGPNLRVVHAPSEHGGLKQFNAHVIEVTGCSAALVFRSLV